MGTTASWTNWVHWKGGRSAGSRATDAPAAGTARSTASATRVSSTWPERVAASTKEGPSQSSINQSTNQSEASSKAVAMARHRRLGCPHQWQQIYTSERSLCLSLSLYLELYVRGKRKESSLGGGHLRIRRENLPAALAGIGAACTLDETGIPIRTIDINRTLLSRYVRTRGRVWWAMWGKGTRAKFDPTRGTFGNRVVLNARVWLVNGRISAAKTETYLNYGISAAGG